MKVNKKLIRVEWYDHCSYNGWLNHNVADDWCEEKPIICITVGWLWYEDSKKLVIAQTITPNQVSELQKIIKSDIVHRKYLKA